MKPDGLQTEEDSMIPRSVWISLKMGMCAALCACAPGAPEAPVGSAAQAELNSGTVTALEAVGGRRTGIHYSLQYPPDPGAPQTLVLTALPIGGLIRLFDFPSVTGGLGVKVTNEPPEPEAPATQPLRIDAYPPDPGHAPLARLTTYPPDPGRTLGSAACTVAGSGLEATGWIEPPEPEHTAGGFSFELAGGRSPLVSVLQEPSETGSGASVTFEIPGAGFTVKGGWLQPPDPDRPWTLSFRVLRSNGEVLFDSASALVGGTGAGGP
jgi:hypothetical protein